MDIEQVKLTSQSHKILIYSHKGKKSNTFYKLASVSKKLEII